MNKGYFEELLFISFINDIDGSSTTSRIDTRAVITVHLNLEFDHEFKGPRHLCVPLEYIFNRWLCSFYILFKSECLFDLRQNTLYILTKWLEYGFFLWEIAEFDVHFWFSDSHSRVLCYWARCSSPKGSHVVTFSEHCTSLASDCWLRNCESTMRPSIATAHRQIVHVRLLLFRPQNAYVATSSYISRATATYLFQY